MKKQIEEHKFDFDTQEDARRAVLMARAIEKGFFGKCRWKSANSGTIVESGHKSEWFYNADHDILIKDDHAVFYKGKWAEKVKPYYVSKSSMSFRVYQSEDNGRDICLASFHNNGRRNEQQAKELAHSLAKRLNDGEA